MSIDHSQNTLFFPPSTTSSRLISIKIIIILVILCRFAHQNNSNFFPSLMALYLDSAVTCVNAITLLNHLGLSVLYNV